MFFLRSFRFALRRNSAGPLPRRLLTLELLEARSLPDATPLTVVVPVLLDSSNNTALSAPPTISSTPTSTMGTVSSSDQQNSSTPPPNKGSPDPGSGGSSAAQNGSVNSSTTTANTSTNSVVATQQTSLAVSVVQSAEKPGNKSSSTAPPAQPPTAQSQSPPSNTQNSRHDGQPAAPKTAEGQTTDDSSTTDPSTAATSPPATSISAAPVVNKPIDPTKTQAVVVVPSLPAVTVSTDAGRPVSFPAGAVFFGPGAIDPCPIQLGRTFPSFVQFTVGGGSEVPRSVIHLGEPIEPVIRDVVTDLDPPAASPEAEFPFDAPAAVPWLAGLLPPSGWEPSGAIQDLLGTLETLAPALPSTAASILGSPWLISVAVVLATLELARRQLRETDEEPTPELPEITGPSGLT